MKKLIMGLVIAMVAGSAFATTDRQLTKVVKDIRKGEQNQNAIETLYVTGNASIGGTITSDGSTTITGSASVGGFLALTPTSLTVTNGQVITPTSSWMVLSPTGVVVSTNTIAYTGVGDVVTFSVLGSSTNSVLIADAAETMALGSDVTLGASDTLTIGWVTATNAVGISSRNN